MANLTAMKPQGNDKTPPGPPRTIFSSRRRMVGEWLTKIHLLAGRDLPDLRNEQAQKSWTLLLGTWDEALGDIPEEHLAECFGRAVRSHRTPFMLGHDAVLTAWDEMREDMLRYPPPPPVVTGYLPDGAPVEYYNLGPAIAELKRWSQKLGWWVDGADTAGLVKRSDGLLIGYALAVKLHYAFSVADAVEWIRDMGQMVFEDKGSFDDLLTVLHAKEAHPMQVPFSPDPCPICKGLGHIVITDRHSSHVNTYPEARVCRECGGRG